MKRLMITAAALALLTTTAQAGMNTCEGEVQVGPEWTVVKSEFGNYAPNGCRFLTASKLARRILAVCPNGANCMIDVSLKELKEGSDTPGAPPRTIKVITNASALKAD